MNEKDPAMSPKHHSLIVAAVLAGIGSTGPSAAQNSDEEAYSITLELIESAYTKQRTDLFESYAGAVERLQNQFQSQGDLANALLARQEAELGRESATLGDEDFPGVGRLREILQAELSKIETARVTKLNTARREYVARLKDRVAELTRQGDLDEALRLDAMRQTLEAELADPTKPAEEMAATAPATQASGDLKQGEVLFGELILSGGSHRLRDELQIGKRQDHTEEERGFLTVKDRAEISGGAIWTNFGTLVAENSRFEGVALTEELQGTFTATRTLFENCTFAKKGGWQVAWFGTKWHFDECVFHGSFFPEWTNAQVGLNITNCTFIDVEFPSFQMKTDQDVAWQSNHQWRTIEMCRFIGCEIPLSVLLATRDCVFEDCTFVEDQIHETRQLLSSLTESIRVTVYYTGLEAPEIVPPSPNLKIEVKRATRAQENWGCPPFYTLMEGALQFR